ncbi:unnamed protein product [Spirodela intermedia]|uniref:Uncharacterized protein n=1 Tax=Spirodela intermedia TaxID=51605 RepID=A0A7I8L8S7_SPIIN|nr:unnamed protein product [Spirodela intermedia]
MDPNPKSFPVVSYVLSRLHLGSGSRKNPPEADIDIEQPSPREDDGGREQQQFELVERMPRLKQPELLASMAQAISDVAGTRSILRNLGDRPDHEAVDAARARIAEIDAALAADLVALGDAAAGDLETEYRGKAEREKFAYRAVIQLEEMHAAYEELLREAEERLVKIYDSAEAEEPPPPAVAELQFGGGVSEEAKDGGEQTDEEVVRILQEASERCVERVNLSGRGLRFIPEAFGRLRGLLILNLSNNQLEVVPDSIAGLENLQELRLSSNLLTSLPDSIGLLVNLKILVVSGNKLKFLPDSISRCRSLVELDASFNELTYLPTNIGHELVDLQGLSIGLNKIRSLPSSVCEMISLRRLDARFNELRGLPHAIGSLTNLETLDLSNNFSDLTALPETIGDLVGLRELDLSNNQIHALPDAFGRLENLSKLNLEGNPLVLPPVEVVNQGVEAVKEFMSRRWLEILLEEEQRATVEAAPPQSPQAAGGGWLSRSASLLNSLVSGVSGSVTGYLAGADRSPRDPFLDQQL